VAVLAYSKEWRLFFHPAHFIAIAVMLGIAAAWAIPFVYSTQTEGAMGKWSAQFTGRLEGIDFKFSGWAQNIPRALVYFLPWLLLLPFARFSKLHGEAQQRLACALSWGIAVPFVAVNLVPGAVARYSMPAIVPASWLVAMIYAGDALRWPRRWTTDDRGWARIVAAFVALGLVIGAIGYPITAVVLRNRQQVKKAAAEINAVVPATETLYAVDPDYQPVLFYVNASVQYVSDVNSLPRDVHYFLVRTKDEGNALAERKWTPLSARPVARVHDYSERKLTLFRVGPANEH
jgi:hypothetical protein